MSITLHNIFQTLQYIYNQIPNVFQIFLRDFETYTLMLLPDFSNGWVVVVVVETVCTNFQMHVAIKLVDKINGTLTQLSKSKIQ